MVTDRERESIDHFVKSIERSTLKRIKGELIWAKKCLNNARHAEGRAYWTARYRAINKLWESRRDDDQQDHQDPGAEHHALQPQVEPGAD